MATQRAVDYRHKKYNQRKRTRDEDGNGIGTFSTDSDSSLEPDQDNYTLNLPKQKKVCTTNLTPKQKFKTEKAINELRIRIQLINLNDNEPQKIDLPIKDDNNSSDRKESTLPASTSTTTTDSNGNILNSVLAKRGRPQVSASARKADKESLSDDEINQKLIKLDIPQPDGPPPNRRVTFGGFSHSAARNDIVPKETKQVRFEGFEQIGKIARTSLEQTTTTTSTTTTTTTTEQKIKFSSKKMGRSKTIKEINIEDEWKSYKAANLSFKEFATRTSSFGMK